MTADELLAELPRLESDDEDIKELLVDVLSGDLLAEDIRAWRRMGVRIGHA